MQRHGLFSASGIDAEAKGTGRACTEGYECTRLSNRSSTQEIALLYEATKHLDSLYRCQKRAGSDGGLCKLNIASYSSKSHVADVAHHAWMLPFFLDKVHGSVHNGLQQLIVNMSLPLDLRPSFSLAVEELESLQRQLSGRAI